MQPDLAHMPNHGRAARQRTLVLSLAPLLGGLLALALYASTLPAGLTWANNGADGGDLLAAALTAGVPHPTGYPTYQLLLRLAIALLPGDPARAGAWLSALCTALAVGLLVDLGRRQSEQWAAGGWVLGSLAGLVAGLAWAVSPLVWGQAVIVEVYALNALFCVALLCLMWRWGEAVEAGRNGRVWLAAAGFVLGVGLGNHLTLALVLPGLVVWFWAKGWGRPLRRDQALAGVALLAGLLVYAYLPLAAAARPPINWGDPATLDGFLWLVTGRAYSGLAFGLPLAELPGRLLAWAGLTVGQFLPWGLVGALAGLYLMQSRLRAWWLTTLLVWLAFTVYAIGYNTADSDAYLIPALAVMALWLAEGLAALFARLAAWPIALAGTALVAVLFLALIPAAWSWEDQNLTRDWQAQAVLAALHDAAPNAVILTAGDRDTFALWYGSYGLKERPDVAVISINLYGFDWYRRTLADTHPGLLVSVDRPERLETLIARWLTERPVYATEDVGLPLDLGERVKPTAILMPVVRVSD